jgi:hypothetical protein
MSISRTPLRLSVVRGSMGVTAPAIDIGIRDALALIRAVVCEAV